MQFRDLTHTISHRYLEYQKFLNLQKEVDFQQKY